MLALAACDKRHAADDSRKADVDQVLAAAETAASAATTEQNIANANDPRRAAAIADERKWEQEQSALGLKVSVRDRKTGLPLAGFGIGETGLQVTDADGNLKTRRSLPRQGERITVHCPTRLMFKGRRIVDAPFVIRNGYAEAHFEIDSTSCKEPLTTQLRGRHAGMYLSEFEQSAFFPCVGLSGADAYGWKPHSAWANLPASLEDSFIWRLRMSNADEGMYVEWTGTLTGPGNYGHMGMSLYEFDVERLDKLSSTRPSACKAPGLDEALRERARYRAQTG